MALKRGSGWSAPRWVRFAVPATALVVVAATALIAGPVLISNANSGPTPTPSSTVTNQPTGTATDSATPDTTFPPIIDVPTGPPASPTPIPADRLSGYVWPLNDAKITLPFGPSKWGEFLVGGKLFHDGVDMATQCGDKVMAAHDGTVLVASRDAVDFMGWQGDLTAFKRMFSPPSWKATLPIIIVIDDGNGYRSIYAHESRVTVKVNQHVTAGQTIGYEGATGPTTGCHVHFGLYSTLEKATFDNLPDYMSRLHLPATITARIDPLLVLPYRNDLSEMRSLRPLDAAAYASAHPKG
jgi:murein DD-endopeptidase MepM/ murein hydrolase activator NlpD